MAHFDYISDVIITMSLGLASDLREAEVISKQKSHFVLSAEDGQFAGGIGVDLQRKIRSLRLQFMGASNSRVTVYVH